MHTGMQAQCVTQAGLHCGCADGAVRTPMHRAPTACHSLCVLEHHLQSVQLMGIGTSRDRAVFVMMGTFGTTPHAYQVRPSSTHAEMHGALAVLTAAHLPMLRPAPALVTTHAPVLSLGSVDWCVHLFTHMTCWLVLAGCAKNGSWSSATQMCACNSGFTWNNTACVAGSTQGG